MTSSSHERDFKGSIGKLYRSKGVLECRTDVEHLNGTYTITPANAVMFLNYEYHFGAREPFVSDKNSRLPYDGWGLRAAEHFLVFLGPKGEKIYLALHDYEHTLEFLMREFIKISS